MQLTPLEWLEREAYRAEAYEIGSIADGETLRAEYWHGYHEATLNAIAAVYGPTDLDEEVTE